MFHVELPVLIDVHEFVDMPEIARRVKLHPAAARKWKTRYDDFPDPVLMLDIGEVWWWPTVEAWVSEKGLSNRGTEDANGAGTITVGRSGGNGIPPGAGGGIPGGAGPGPG